jgi:hypothetical protein
MLSGQPALAVLSSLRPDRPLFVDSTPAKLAEAVAEEVESAEALDVHAHCFAPEFGPGLARFGIDGLLTAAYADEDLACSADLVAQYLAVRFQPLWAMGGKGEVGWMVGAVMAGYADEDVACSADLVTQYLAASGAA